MPKKCLKVKLCLIYHTAALGIYLTSHDLHPNSLSQQEYANLQDNYFTQRSRSPHDHGFPPTSVCDCVYVAQLLLMIGC